MKNIDVVILCGGLGKRLRSAVNDRPKSLAEVNGVAFLDILIKYVASFGLKRFVLCSGYMGDAIKEHYDKTGKSLETVFVREEEPLGTGGALKNAQSFIKSEPFLVLNGDSFCKLNFRDFYSFHSVNKALLSIVLCEPKVDQNSGAVKLGQAKRIVEFNEKVKTEEKSFRSAGIYLMGKEIFRFMERKKVFSLEYDLFPALAGKDCYGYFVKNDFIDIGTPESLAKAGDFLKHV